MDVTGKIKQANGRLKNSKVRCRIEQIGEKLYLKATLPPKPSSTKTKPLEPNSKLGTKVSGFFYDRQIYKNETDTLTAYDLRHCYARRCFEFGLSPDVGAKLMGHSVNTHTRVYRRWIDEAVYWKIYDAAVNRPDRPLCP
ncbi:MAG: hypothetical protein F6K19_34115 [Cyanothece sp. SIO1E1]|nr:hypothetical protein [Cyanothece sp. SIO1E1]